MFFNIFSYVDKFKNQLVGMFPLYYGHPQIIFVKRSENKMQ